MQFKCNFDELWCNSDATKIQLRDWSPADLKILFNFSLVVFYYKDQYLWVLCWTSQRYLSKLFVSAYRKDGRARNSYPFFSPFQNSKWHVELLTIYHSCWVIRYLLFSWIILTYNMNGYTRFNLPKNIILVFSSKIVIV